MRASKVILLTLGSLLGLIGLVAAAAGGFITWAYATQRDDGYFTTSTERFATESYALVSEDLDLRLGLTSRQADWILDVANAQARIRLANPGGEAVFVGVAPSGDAAGYLEGVGRSVITEVDQDPFRVTYREEPGGAPGSPPGEQGFWAARASGRGPQTLSWGVEEGDWTVVAMNADGSAGVVVEASWGAKAGLVLPLGLGLLIGGLIGLAIGTGMVVAGARIEPKRRPPAQPAEGPMPSSERAP